MNFASLEFAVFMAIVYLGYAALPHRGQNLLLLAGSYVFYGWWDWRFLSLILFSTVVDYAVGLLLHRTSTAGRRRLWLCCSLVTNLGLLALFKYYNFFAESAESAASQLGWTLHWTTTKIVLPVGISFYTFQTLSYTIDIYRGKLEPTRRFLDFALFVAFFPQLVAGPIERATNLLPQILRERRVELDRALRGAFLILLGLFKKVVIADGIAPSVDSVYGSAAAASATDVLLATYLFAIQIYCDFSGYSDVARGLCKTLGFELMNNFDQPYVSTNPREFWRRWHISLSTWLRDYLYVPLGGSKGGVARMYVALMATMVLGGLWHGAAWNFVLWGVFHGALLCGHRLIRGTKPPVERPGDLRSFIRWTVYAVVFFHITCYGWLLFRAQSFDQVIRFTSILFTGWGESSIGDLRPPLASLAGLLILMIMEVFQYASRSTRYYALWPEPARAGLYAALFVLLLMGTSNGSVQFIYFQF